MKPANNTFFKFMKDLITSGTWAKLSSAARTLYPVLCQFTDESFKHVWPGTETLLNLTGFKTKKSLQQAKKDLISAGLIDVIPGSGRTPSRYYFRFDYEGSSVTTHRDIKIPPRGRQEPPRGGDDDATLGGTELTPNHINININNNSDKQISLLSDLKTLLENFVKDKPRPENLRDQIVDSLIKKYGQLETGEAIKIAIERGKDGDIRYLEGILRNRQKDRGRQNKNTNISPGILDERLAKAAAESGLSDQIASLKMQYMHNDTYYFTSRSMIDVNRVTDALQKVGLKCKILCRAMGA